MLSFITKKSPVRNIIFILIGTFLMSMAVNMIYDPMHMVTGGVAGLAIMVKYMTAGIVFTDGIPVWLTTLVLNVPLYLISWKVFGTRYICKSVIGTASYTFFMYLIPVGPIFEADYLLSAIFGGVLTGLGLGLVFLAQGTTGGTDMLGILIHHRKPYISVPRLLLIIDGIIVISGAGMFGMNKALYAVIAVYVVTKVSDGILEGLKFAKCANIVSDKYEEIANEILIQLDRGVTGINAEGMYSHAEKKMLYCVVGQKEIIKLLEAVYHIDPNAFVTITDVREVWGEGYEMYKG
ncbi:MAG: YitT family protein [Lachnospiraceae bacterium]|nr:YitT family protein [Lachnospiraceae bacterium]